MDEHAFHEHEGDANSVGQDNHLAGRLFSIDAKRATIQPHSIIAHYNAPL